MAKKPTVGQIAAETSWSVRVGESFERIVGDWSFGGRKKIFLTGENESRCFCDVPWNQSGRGGRVTQGWRGPT